MKPNTADAKTGHKWKIVDKCAEIRGWRGIVVIIKYEPRYKLKLARDKRPFPTRSS